MKRSRLKERQIFKIIATIPTMDSVKVQLFLYRSVRVTVKLSIAVNLHILIN